MTELFPDMPEVLSPKEAWKRRHDIHSLPPCEGEGSHVVCDLTGEDGTKWIACKGEPSPSNNDTKFGHTEEQALELLAVHLGIKFYREVGYGD